MDNINFFNNFAEPICAFSIDNKVVFKNKQFKDIFSDFKSIEKFKKCFNFDLCYLSFENIKNKTPIDFILNSKENFHTICTYQNKNDEFVYYYIYTFRFNDLKIVIFKDLTIINNLNTIEKSYQKLKKSYNEIKELTKKYEQLKGQAQLQMLKMSIINRISIVISETNDIETILSLALKEIHNLSGSFKTYFSEKEKNYFKINYSVTDKHIINECIEYEEEIIDSIKNKKITVTSCLKEHMNADEIMPKGVKRIIIPIYDKNNLLGIIVTLTKQHFNEKENREILQSISVQIASAIIKADLIQKLDKKNKKLAKTLIELKETQIQLINTEKMASLGQLVSGVAHEINTPLASINSNNLIVQKIINSSKHISTEQFNILRELNDIDIEAAKRISNIVKSLKRFIHLDEAEIQEANINSELDLTLKLTAHEIKKNTKIIKNYGRLPMIKCYANMLNQVFMNLIVNACHAIDKENGIIEITTLTDEKNLIVKIKDNGIGISKENREKIFLMGFTTKKAGIGTGLGLSISKKIIEMHKGSINFTTKEKEGSEFVITIPIKQS